MINLLKKMRILLLFCFLQNSLSSQTVICDSIHWAKPGTYEIMNSAESFESEEAKEIKILPTADLLCLIEGKRDQNNIVVFNYTNNIVVRVFPRNTINIIKEN